MTPVQLDLVLNGAFIYEASDGRPFASIDYKLRDYGVKLLRRAGPMTEADFAGDVAAYLARVNETIARSASHPNPEAR